MTVLHDVSPFVSAYRTSVEKEEVILALDLASHWEFPNVRNQCITLLEKKSIAPAEKLALAQRFDIVAWLESEVTRLVLRDEPLSVDEANEIGIGMATRIAILREKRLAKLLRMARRAAIWDPQTAEAEVEFKICEEIKLWIRKSVPPSVNDLAFALQRDIETATTTAASVSSPGLQDEDTEQADESESEAAISVQGYTPNSYTLYGEALRTEWEVESKQDLFRAAMVAAVSPALTPGTPTPASTSTPATGGAGGEKYRPGAQLRGRGGGAPSWRGRGSARTSSDSPAPTTHPAFGGRGAATPERSAAPAVCDRSDRARRQDGAQGQHDADGFTSVPRPVWTRGRGRGQRS